MVTAVNGTLLRLLALRIYVLRFNLSVNNKLVNVDGHWTPNIFFQISFKRNFIFQTRSSETAFLRTVLAWLSTCIPYQLNIFFQTTQKRNLGRTVRTLYA